MHALWKWHNLMFFHGVVPQLYLASDTSNQLSKYYDFRVHQLQSSACYLWFRFHPTCINMTAEEAKRLDHFFCESCSTEGQQKLQNSHSNSRHSDAKVFLIYWDVEPWLNHTAIFGPLAGCCLKCKCHWICLWLIRPISGWFLLFHLLDV